MHWSISQSNTKWQKIHVNPGYQVRQTKTRIADSKVLCKWRTDKKCSGLAQKLNITHRYDTNCNNKLSNIYEWLKVDMYDSLKKRTYSCNNFLNDEWNCRLCLDSMPLTSRCRFCCSRLYLWTSLLRSCHAIESCWCTVDNFSASVFTTCQNGPNDLQPNSFHVNHIIAAIFPNPVNLCGHKNRNTF